MTGSGRKRVSHIDHASILDKRFRRAIVSAKQAGRGKVHPLIVLADLRNGSLGSLDRYLAQEGGIPDREVALELRKLISGTAQRTDYRLAVVNHPDKPSQGGRPSGKKDRAELDRRAERDRHIVACYQSALAEEGKAYLAKERVAAQLKCSKTAVERAIRNVRGATEKERELERMRRLRIDCLERARNPSDR